MQAVFDGTGFGQRLKPKTANDWNEGFTAGYDAGRDRCISTDRPKAIERKPVIRKEANQNILDEIYDFLGRFVSFPSDDARIAVTAWIAHTYLLPAFYATPRLAVLSAEKRSGKTRLLEITKLLVQNPEPMVSPSPASLYYLIKGSEVTPTFLIDEIGRLLERKDISDLVSIVEAGFQPGQTVNRANPDSGNVNRYPVHAPTLMAGIDNGRMPDTILDRSIIIRMKRNIGPRLKYRPRKHAQDGFDLAKKIAEWAKTILERAKTIEPVMPEELNDREQDKWEPLFIVAHLADVSRVSDVSNVSEVSRWIGKIRRAALTLSNEDKETEETSHGEQLLKDIDFILENDILETDRMKTTELLDKLNDISDSPWSCFNYNKPLDGRGLARLLKPYGIKPRQIRFGETTDKGYYRSDFDDARNRYLAKHPKISETIETEETQETSSVPNLAGIASSQRDFEAILAGQSI